MREAGSDRDGCLRAIRITNAVAANGQRASFRTEVAVDQHQDPPPDDLPLPDTGRIRVA